MVQEIFGRKVIGQTFLSLPKLTNQITALPVELVGNISMLPAGHLKPTNSPVGSLGTWTKGAEGAAAHPLLARGCDCMSN